MSRGRVRRRRPVCQVQREGARRGGESAGWPSPSGRGTQEPARQTQLAGHRRGQPNQELTVKGPGYGARIQYPQQRARHTGPRRPAAAAPGHGFAASRPGRAGPWRRQPIPSASPAAHAALDRWRRARARTRNRRRGLPQDPAADPDHWPAGADPAGTAKRSATRPGSPRGSAPSASTAMPRLASARKTSTSWI